MIEKLIILLLGLSDIFIFILFKLVNKISLSSDKYLKKKAENMATKQDIAEITRRTETVQAEFHKILGKFDADLKFKYEFYEKQYTELYSELFCEVCSSEARRYIFVNVDEKQYMHFNNVPIVKYTETYNNNQDSLIIEENSVEKKIINLVHQRHIYASPELLKLICALDELSEYEREKIEENNKTDKIEKNKVSQVNLKIKLVKTILKDYYWLRKQLKLQKSEDEIAKLETGTFIFDLQ